MPYPMSSLPYQVHQGDTLAADILTKLKTVDGANSGLDADKVDGKEAADLFVKATDTSDNIPAGETTEVPPKGVATEAKQVYAGNPWIPPRFELLDPTRFHLERVSGGRATIFYSSDGNKIPIEAVWLDAFNCADISPYFARARANSTAYLLGEWLIANGQLYEVTTAGTSGSSAPAYGVNLGDTVADGGAMLTLRVNSYNDLYPAFRPAGVAKGGKWYARFQCTVSGANPRSIAGLTPTSVTIDQFRTYASKFADAAPWTNWDYEALALDAFRKGITPVGNTYYGRSHKSTELMWGGIRGDGARPGDSSVTSNPYTRGGSAGAIWTHDRTMWGVHDFIGNMAQWVDGAKFMDGQLYIAAHDADPSLLSLVGEESWIPTGIFLNSPIAGDDSGSNDLGAPNFDGSVTNFTASLAPPRDVATIKADTRDLDYTSQTWGSLVVSVGIDSLDAASRLSAFRMGLMPKSRSAGPSPLSAQEGRFYMRNNGERFMRRGGYYSNTSYSGTKCIIVNDRRASTNAFRLVFNK
jgi:sulfatase modifying factor 1